MNEYPSLKSPKSIFICALCCGKC